MLAAWYEWAEPVNQRVAGILQDAADAVREKALSTEAAEALIAVWQPFVGLEARIANAPSTIQPESADSGALASAVKDLGRMLQEAKTPQGRRFLTKLLNQQITNYERGATQAGNHGSV